MQPHLQIVLLVLLAITVIVLISQIREKKLELEYSITWLLLLFTLFIFVLFPGLQNWVSKLMGIAAPVNMIFFLGFCFALVIMYRLTKAISKISKETKLLAQRITVLEEEIKSLKKTKSGD